MRPRRIRPLPYPTNDELSAEAQEAKPEVYFMVYDESGAPIRRVDGATEAGFQRVAWDLRYPAATVHEVFRERRRGFSPDAADQGPLVLPGTYSVRLFEKVGGAVTELAEPQSFKVVTEGCVGDERSRPRGAGGVLAEGDAALPGRLGSACTLPTMCSRV